MWRFTISVLLVVISVCKSLQQDELTDRVPTSFADNTRYSRSEQPTSNGKLDGGILNTILMQVFKLNGEIWNLKNDLQALENENDELKQRLKEESEKIDKIVFQTKTLQEYKNNGNMLQAIQDLSIENSQNIASIQNESSDYLKLALENKQQIGENQDKINECLELNENNRQQIEAILDNNAKYLKKNEENEKQITEMQATMARKDKFIVNEICKKRFDSLPTGCTSGECCMKYVFESVIQCLPNCSNGGRNSSCPAGYSLYKDGGFCYKVHSKCTTWDEGRKVCKAEGGDLVVLPNGSTFQYFQNVVKNAVKSRSSCNVYGFWIGMTDKAREGDWRWVDGTKLGSYAQWQPNQPDNMRGEDCGHLWHHVDGAYWPTVLYRFNDAPCSLNQLSFICAIQ